MSQSWFKLRLLGIEDDLVTRRASKRFDNNLTMQAIYASQRNILLEMKSDYNQTFLNNFIETANVVTVQKWENLLGILADPTAEDLNFRRMRVLNYISTNAPFTNFWLSQKFEGMFPDTTILYKINYNEYLIKVAISSSDLTSTENFKMLVNFLKNIIPANMLLEIELDIPYTHNYLSKYTHEEMEQFTFDELSSQKI